jgi:hypothetical protein
MDPSVLDTHKQAKAHTHGKSLVRRSQDEGGSQYNPAPPLAELNCRATIQVIRKNNRKALPL